MTSSGWKQSLSRWIAGTVLVALLGFGSWVAVASSTQSSTAPQVASSSNACIADESAIEELKRKRSELESKEKALAEKELEIAAKEKAIEERLKKLDEVKAEIAQSNETKKKEQALQVEKLVITFETMSPKAVAQVISTLDEGLAVQAISKIQTPKLAKILNLMDPAKSARLTELLAGVDRKKSSSIQSERGGERKNGQNDDVSSATSERQSNESDSGEKRPDTSATERSGGGSSSGSGAVGNSDFNTVARAG